jgi:hypothetical protein
VKRQRDGPWECIWSEGVGKLQFETKMNINLHKASMFCAWSLATGNLPESFPMADESNGLRNSGATSRGKT